MTTRVRITYPTDGTHAPEVEVRGVYPHNTGVDQTLLATLKPGQTTDQYVHFNQHIMIVEKFP